MFDISLLALAALIVASFHLVCPLFGQSDQSSKVSPEANDDDGFFVRDSTTQRIAVATTLVGLGFQGSLGAPAQLALMKIGEQRGLWLLGVGDRAIPLVPKYLAKIRDHRALANGLDPKTDDSGELSAYVDAIVKANLTPVEAMTSGALRDVSRTNLFSEPHRFRGEVIHLEGKLRLVEKLPAPLMVSYLGIHELYEAWIFENGYGANPSCLLLTELPEGIIPGSQNDLPVAFDGYFFKIYRYKSRDRSKDNPEREAPLFIGRTLNLLKGPPQQEKQENAQVLSLSSPLLGLFLGFIVCSFLLALGLTLWFRRNDNRVRARLRSAKRDFMAPDSGLDADPESPWPKEINNPGLN
ncbi:MAG TPA: hypothetical protein VGZ25_13345 [Gemmataceae bacterium]|nr:hypothetical protein [Gemmataceae bacterium]